MDHVVIEGAVVVGVVDIVLVAVDIYLWQGVWQCWQRV